MRTSKDYFIYYIKENILLFDIFDYIEELGGDCVDFFFEWNLVKDDKILSKNKILKEFIEKQVQNAELIIDDKSKKLNCKVLCYFKEKKDLNVWSSFFEEPLKFIKIAKRSIKKNFPSFLTIDSEDEVFSLVKGTFDGIPCIIPSGEDEEILLKLQRKLKKG